MIGLKRGIVELVPYNQNWKNLFDKEKIELSKILGNKAKGIEHIGSTAIPGISAKPVIDIALGIENMSEVDTVKEILEKNGWIWRPKFGDINKHIVFAKGNEIERTHYLHVMEYKGRKWNERIGFRDYLISNNDKRKEYEDLKIKAMQEFSEDRKEYTKQKDKFVEEIIQLSLKESKMPPTEQHKRKSELYTAIVWILAGFSLLAYCTIGLLNSSVPGVEELVYFLSITDGKYIYLAAFISVFIEGLYFVGNFFPGSTLIVLISVISQLSGYFIFALTIIAIFLGWSLAGLVNIFFAKVYHSKIAKLQSSHEFEVKDRIWTTWFPAFRANYEVAQITSGGIPFKVFISSVRVKLIISIVAGICIQIVPFFVDINNLNNEEGFASVFVVAVVSFAVGGLKLKKYFLSKD